MLTQLETVTDAFKSWNTIRDEASAQAYLLSMLGSKERREKRASPPKQKKSRKNKQPPPTTEPIA
jgi:hypothetical protein